jgi:hypothetical protein
MKTMGHLMDTEFGQAAKEKAGEGLNYLGNTKAGQMVGLGISTVQEKINDVINYGVDQGEIASEYIRNIFGLSPSENLEDLMLKTDEVDAISGASQEGFSNPENGPGFIGPIKEEVGSLELEEENLDKKLPEIPENTEWKGSFYIQDKKFLDGKTDSVWRSLEKGLINNPERYGYGGDIDNADEVRKWSHKTIAEALQRAGYYDNDSIKEFYDHVESGDMVNLSQDQNGNYWINIVDKVDAGAGEWSPSEEYIGDQKRPEGNINKMKPRPFTGLETKEPLISDLNPVEDSPVKDSPLSEEGVDNSEGNVEEYDESSPEEPTEEIKTENQEASDYDKMSNLVGSIGEEGGLKSDLEQTYDKWADNIQKQSEITDMDDINSSETDSRINESTIVSPEDSEDSINTEDTKNIEENNQSINEQEILEKDQEGTRDISEELGKRLAESWIKTENVAKNTSEIYDYLIRNRHLIPEEALEDLENTFIIGGRRNIFGKVSGGVETSLANELNRIVGIEDFYQNLNGSEQNRFKFAFSGLARGVANSWNLNKTIIMNLLTNISKK